MSKSASQGCPLLQNVYLHPWYPVWAECTESSGPGGARDGGPCGHTLTPCLPNDKAENCSPAFANMTQAYFGSARGTAVEMKGI